MTPIKPVHLNDTGAAVSNLHKGLLFIIMDEPGISDNDRQSLQRQLAPEMHPEKFGQATFKLVRTLQEQLNSRLDIPKEHKPGVQNGDVDEKTADALNFLLRQLGALH